jgi:hypothetical protein
MEKPTRPFLLAALIVLLSAPAYSQAPGKASPYAHDRADRWAGRFLAAIDRQNCGIVVTISCRRRGRCQYEQRRLQTGPRETKSNPRSLAKGRFPAFRAIVCSEIAMAMDEYDEIRL